MNKWTKAALVALRLAVGWHFLYEGLWKIHSDDGVVAYAPTRDILQAATARLRARLDAPQPQAAAFAAVDAWNDEIVRYFGARKQLDEGQKTRLSALADAVKTAAADSPVAFDWVYLQEEILKVEPEPESERFSSLPFIRAAAGPFRGFFRGLPADIDGLARLTPTSALATLDHRYAQILRHYSDARLPFDAAQQARFAAAHAAIRERLRLTLDEPHFKDRLADYRALRQRLAADASAVHAAYSRERLDASRKQADTIAGELLALVNEPLSELAVQAQAIATPAQFAAGPLPRPADGARWLDMAVTWALTLIGLCLLLGLATPVAALLAAGQLALFYFASPPWPGLPAATLGGHYMYVDRNLIELAAALVVAASSAGHRSKEIPHAAQ